MKYDYKIKKEEHLFEKDFKLKWLGEGEWIEEADKIDFEYAGYEAEVRRVLIQEPYALKEAWFGGHLCGYVIIPQNHFLYMRPYKDFSIDCHWGLTYGDFSEGGSHRIGFDCGHMNDIIPTVELIMLPQRKLYGTFLSEFEHSNLLKKTYKNVQFSIDNCCYIIDQLTNINFEKMVELSSSYEK